jgi:N-methylhydantoinase A
VTLSHRLVREYREYERLTTAVVNAYVGPVMARHLVRLAPAAPRGLRVMQSSGGLVAGRVARAEPVRTVLSGPAGGVVGAAARARRAGLLRVVTFDMGGTSADVSLVDGAPAWRTETRVGDLPIRVPAVDISTVGAGGGSLARLDGGGALRVGPESAGADPGPACYGRGAAATVTDANLVLGRLVETEFLGGAMRLERGRAERAIRPLARRLGASLEEAAAGIVRVANAAMERALRVVTVERGHDPRDFVLVAFGGAGGLHAADLARALRMRRVYVPREPGLLSAWGVLAAEVVRDWARTLLAVEPPPRVLRAAFAALERSARRAMRQEDVPRPALQRSLDVRYVGQSYELNVPWSTGWVAAFHRLHATRFGHADPRRPVELVTIRLRARGGRGAPATRGASTAVGRALLARRRVFFDGRAVATPVVRREELAVGARRDGPLVVCEYSATTVVPPGWRLWVEPTGGLLLEAPG